MSLVARASAAVDSPAQGDSLSHAAARARRASAARQASLRRKKIDPTTCERDYSAAEIEFMQAMQDYKQASGRMFPTWSEVLEVVVDLGYSKAVLEATQ
jgi:hypothetical protein